MAQMVRESGERNFRSSANYSAAGQYKIVALVAGTQNDIVLANAQTLPIIGVLLNAPAQYKEARVAMNQGTVKVLLGGTVTVGAYITADSAGLGIATTTGNDMVIGMALEAGDAADIVEVKLSFFRY